MNNNVWNQSRAAAKRDEMGHVDVEQSSLQWQREQLTTVKPPLTSTMPPFKSGRRYRIMRVVAVQKYTVAVDADVGHH